MHGTTAVVLLQQLARHELLQVKHTTFYVPPYPQPIHLLDVKECFEALRDTFGLSKTSVMFTHGTGLSVWTSGKFFEKVFKLVFINEKLYPVERTGNLKGDMGREAPLPTLFIGSEKTQVRQIPLAETRPWPFKFLLELGGMIVCRSTNKRDMLLELRQFLNNHPQYKIKVDAKEWPDGSVAIFTWWFEKLPRLERKHNVNVPS